VGHQFDAGLLDLAIHSRLTHSYLFSTDDYPTYDSCELPLTAKHILVECFNLQIIM